MSYMAITQEAATLSLSEQLNLLSYLANLINARQHQAVETKAVPKRLGVAKGKFEVPDDIDFCNDEIAEMFGVN